MLKPWVGVMVEMSWVRERYFVGEGFEDGGFAGVVESQHQDTQLLFFVLAQVAQNADQTSCLACH
jgi:hypothetical protein